MLCRLQRAAGLFFGIIHCCGEEQKQRGGCGHGSVLLQTGGDLGGGGEAWSLSPALRGRWLATKREESQQEQKQTRKAERWPVLGVQGSLVVQWSGQNYGCLTSLVTVTAWTGLGLLGCEGRQARCDGDGDGDIWCLVQARQL